ncbi:MAG: hypothetical protein WCC04_10330 [Terriglobales bacterium]
MATQPTTTSSATAEEQNPNKNRQRPTKVLPTDRITFSKQIDLLKAWAAASNPVGKIVSNTDVADMVKMQSSTISLANPFFASIGLLQKAEGGYIPSGDVIAFFRAAEYSDTPIHKLASLMRESWFGLALLPKLAYRPMTEAEALTVLHDAAGAGADYRNQLKTLIDYLIAAGVAQKDGDVIKTAKPAFEFGPSGNPPPSEPPVGAVMEPTVPAKQNVATAFAASPEGGISFHISVRVNMEQFSTWKPERITAFFAGIAQMLAAKAKIEGAD